MKKLLLLFLPLILGSCDFVFDPTDGSNNNDQTDQKQEETPLNEPENQEITYADYGAFLGRSEDNATNFDKYKYVSFDFGEFSESTIKTLNDKGIQTFGYLNVGSLETYRSYHNQFKSLTFMDYDNWPDERWIDVSNTNWQSFVINTLAKEIKDCGGSGVYMDNVDVYTICKESKKSMVSGVKQGLKNIIKGVSNLGLKIMMNGGSELIDDFNDENDSILDSIWAYHQEEVFSLIDDYENDVFTRQEKEDSDYYKEIAKIMKNKGKEVFFLEYTKDAELKKEIDDFCTSKKYHYYCSETVDLL